LLPEHTEKLIFKLRRRDLEQLEKLLGKQCRNRWWYREWLARYQDQLSRSEYRALMEAGRSRRLPRVRDWGDEP
jgi:hypothetical protein